jgi:hypothetical protein
MKQRRTTTAHSVNSSVISLLRATLGIVATYLALFSLGSLLFGCSSDRSADSIPSVDLRTEIYSGATSSSMVNDTRLRSSRVTQTQGTIGTLRIGAEIGGVFDFIVLDSGVVYNDSIPADSRVVACTLWLQISQIPRTNADSIVIDLWSIPEDWNENEASWRRREATVDWSISGGFGDLVSASMIVLRRIDLNRFSWCINGVLFDTVATYPSRYLPVPIDIALAQENIDGLSYGFALRTNSATTAGASFALYSSESVSESNRPYIFWVYRIPGS